MSELIALVALVVSIVTFIWSRVAERRIRLSTDIKGTFDAWLLTPTERHIASISQIISEMVQSLRENEDAVRRADTTRKLQKGIFSTWCMDVFGFCESQSDDVLNLLSSETSSLIDTISEQMNRLNYEVDDEVVNDICICLTKAKHLYAAKVRSSFQSARLALK